MPVAHAFVPDPPPSEQVRAPPNAVSTNLPADASVWAAARRSYVEDGCSSEVVAERHGLVARTVRDHALREDWRGLRAARRAAARQKEVLAPEDPAEALLADQRAARRLELLVSHSAAASMSFAAMQMQDALARGAPQEARQWQKLFAELKRDAEALDRAFAGGVDPNERARIAYYRHVLFQELEAADLDVDAGSAAPSP